MSWNETNPVTVGAATKKSDYDRAFDNTLALRAGEWSLPSQAVGDLFFASGSAQAARLAANATATKKFLRTVSGGLPSYEQVDVADLSGATIGAGATVAAAASVSGANTGDNAANTTYTIGSQTQAYSARLDDLAAGVLWRQRNRIDADMTIPDGENAVMVGPFEVGPDVVVTGLGNSTFRGL